MVGPDVSYPERLSSHCLLTNYIGYTKIQGQMGRI